MCGFVAVITPDPEFNAAVLDRMRDRLAHRGPDGAASWLSETGSARVGLGHRRLAIIDLSEAAGQPMAAPEGVAHIVYNGELYNYRALRAQLESLGHVFVNRSDTEVVLHAYLEWGQDCLTRFNGMFAFAIYDARTRALFVARDRFGEKPVFFTRLRAGGVAIASEIKALTTYSSVEAVLDDQVFSSFLEGSYFEHGEPTLFKNINRLDGAHALLVDATGSISRVWRWWTPDYDDVDNSVSAEEAGEHILGLLRKSVSLRMRSDVPIGASLSGGLDSSTIVSLMAKEESAERNLYSVRFDADPTISEGPYIDLITRRVQSRVHSVTPTSADLMRDWGTLLWHLEAPPRSASIFNQFLLLRRVKETGVVVLLDGQGADELLGGYQYYFGLRQLDLLATGRESELERETALLWWRLQRTALKHKDAKRRFDSRPGYELEHLWARRARGIQIASAPTRIGVPDPKKGGLFRRQLALGLLYDHLPNLLQTADRSGMAFSLEARFPFLDYDLVDWCIRLPDDFFIKNGWLKWLLRQATRNILPLPTRWRADKVGFAAPQDRWLAGDCADWAHDLLFNGPISAWPSYDRSALERAWTDHLEGRQDRSDHLWRWLSASEWLRTLDRGDWKASPQNQQEPRRVSA